MGRNRWIPSKTESEGWFTVEAPHSLPTNLLVFGDGVALIWGHYFDCFLVIKVIKRGLFPFNPLNGGDFDDKTLRPVGNSGSFSVPHVERASCWHVGGIHLVVGQN